MIKIITAYKCIHIETYNVTEAVSILSASLNLLGMSIFVALLFLFCVYGNEIIFCFGLYWCLNSSYCYFALLVRLTTFGFGFLCKIARAVGIFFIFWLFSLCKMCPFSELFWSIFSRIQTEYGKILRISPYSLYSTRTRKNADQNNSEYDHFLRSVFDVYFC